MGTKLSSDVAADDADEDVLGTEGILQEKYAWQKDRSIDFHPTASILRYTTTGANPSIRERGAQTLVADLADLPCTVDDFTKSFEQKYGSVAEAGDKLFTFYDVEVVSSDRITYDGDVYAPVARWYREESGRCEVQARVVDES